MESKYVSFSRDNPFGTQAKMVSHIDRLHEYLSTGDTWPIFMEISLTNQCPLHCKWCISENLRGSDSIDISSLRHFLKSFRRHGGKAITYSGGGEPTFYKYFFEAVTAASDEGLELGLMTSGVWESTETTRLIGEHFRWVRISIDTTDKNKYSEWKGADKYENVYSNYIALLKYPIKTGINCNVTKEHSLADIEGILAAFSHAHYFQFRPILPRYFLNEKIDINWGVWEDLIKMQNERINISNDKLEDLSSNKCFAFRSCEGHFFEPALHANGDIAICLYHSGDDRFVFGNININSFEDIWKSKKRKDAIEIVRGLDYKKVCQACCKLSEPNKLLDYLLHPAEITDRNFL